MNIEEVSGLVSKARPTKMVNLDCCYLLKPSYPFK